MKVWKAPSSPNHIGSKPRNAFMIFQDAGGLNIIIYGVKIQLQKPNGEKFTYIVTYLPTFIHSFIHTYVYVFKFSELKVH